MRAHKKYPIPNTPGLVFLRALCLAMLVAVVLPAFAPDVARAASTKAMFLNAHGEFHALTKSRSKARLRENWLKVEKDFSSIYRKEPEGAYAPKSLYYIGRTYEELGQQSGLKSDFRKAVDAYSRAVSRFPRHGWADDCLYRRAEIRYKRLNEWTNARSDLTRILKEYPRSDMAADARALLVKLGGKPPASSASAARPAPKPASKPAPKPAPKAAPKPAPQQQAAKASAHSDPPNTVHLNMVRFKSSDEYTRVVLEMDGHAKYRYKLLASAPEHGRPHRLYIDLQDTRLGHDVPGTTEVSDGILRSVRAGQNDSKTTRVVLDFNSMQDYKVFPLDNPFRIVVDVFSSGAAPAEAARPEPQPQAAAPVRKPAKPQKYRPSWQSKKMVGDLVEQLGLTISTIMIDAGHGGHDPGAQGNGLVEKSVNLEFAKILGGLLEEKGFKVLYTRTKDVFLPLEQRTAIANVKKVDMFISIHCNAHRDKRINGLETYSLNLAKTQAAIRVAARENSVDPKNISDLQYILTDLAINSKMKESKDLANDVQKETLEEVRRKWSLDDKGVREAPFYVLMGAKMPSILVELGYITNYREAKRLKSEQYLTQLARGIVKGVLAYKKQIERYAMK